MNDADQPNQPKPGAPLPQIGPSPVPTAKPKGQDAVPADAPLKEKVVHALKCVYDPEIPVSIYELGLIYEIGISDDGATVNIQMTLTTPNCPEAQSLPMQVQAGVEAIEGVTDCHVAIVWEPMWHKDMMSEEAKLILGMI